MRPIIKVSTADEAIDAMGGPRRVGELLELDERVVWNWRKRGFPSHRYPKIRALMQRERLKFPPDVFARMGRNGGT